VKSGISLDDISKLFQGINHFASSEGMLQRCSVVPTVLVITPTSIEYSKKVETRSLYFVLSAVNLFRVALDYPVSLLRRRRALRQYVYFWENGWGGDIHVNMISGTCVIVNDDVVHKLFFKNSAHYSALNSMFGLAARSIEWPESQSGYSVVTVKRYKLFNLDEEHPRCTFIGKITSELRKLNKIEISRGDLLNSLSPVSRMKQLITDYDATDSNCQIFLDFASKLSVEALSYDIELCHGDVWCGNVLEDDQGLLKLIDFDKSLMFIPLYDYIYAYFMSSRFNLDDTFLRLSDLLHNFKQDLGVLLTANEISWSDKEIELCSWLYFSFKYLERELNGVKAKLFRARVITVIDELI
jgi:hypothetical protein